MDLQTRRLMVALLMGDRVAVPLVVGTPARGPPMETLLLWLVADASSASRLFYRSNRPFEGRRGCYEQRFGG